jgi:hypothetical protein
MLEIGLGVIVGAERHSDFHVTLGETRIVEARNYLNHTTSSNRNARNTGSAQPHDANHSGDVVLVSSTRRTSPKDDQ